MGRCFPFVWIDGYCLSNQWSWISRVREGKHTSTNIKKNKALENTGTFTWQSVLIDTLPISWIGKYKGSRTILAEGQSWRSSKDVKTDTCKINLCLYQTANLPTVLKICIGAQFKVYSFQ